MRQHIEFCVLINCHGNHTVLLHLTTYYLAVKVIGGNFISLLHGSKSGNIKERWRETGASCFKTWKRKRQREVEMERKRKRGGRAEGREGRHKGGRRQSR